tara:strand:- start:615 stop:875 length:261 start_codon:yes stop_codon:yes gene_type:complete
MNDTKTMIDDKVLHSMINQTQFRKEIEEDEFWFSRGKQKQYVFELGAKFMELEDMTSEEAISMAQDYVDTYYKMILSPNSWKKDDT